MSRGSVTVSLQARARHRLKAVRICARAALRLAIVFSVSAGGLTIAAADEGGVSFWLPGLFGSLAAVPQQPGWSLATIYYHDSVTAGADVGRAREFTIGNIPINASANLSARLNSNIDLAREWHQHERDPREGGGPVGKVGQSRKLPFRRD